MRTKRWYEMAFWGYVPVQTSPLWHGAWHVRAPTSAGFYIYYHKVTNIRSVTASLEIFGTSLKVTAPEMLLVLKWNISSPSFGEKSGKCK